MKGIIKVFQAKRYLGNFSSKRTMVWVADVRGLDGNMDITRLSAIDEGCWARLMRYHSAYRFLEQQ